MRFWIALGIITALAAFALGMFVWLGPAAAEKPICAPTEQMLFMLTERYQETMITSRVVNSKTEWLFANRRTGTWSIISTGPKGVLCFVKAGESGQWPEEFKWSYRT
jgi:hypothetical protein